MSTSSSNPGRTPPLTIRGRHFIDSGGRVVILRGVNVGGGSKVPSSDPSIDIPHPHLTSYINRPFPLEEAPTHWKRLRRWGLNHLRITITWEAVEHSGPGIYDEDYLTYLRKLLESMSEYGLWCYVCMHQDVWSRLSGGSGAPAWTIHYAGLTTNPTILTPTCAAYTGGVSFKARSPASKPISDHASEGRDNEEGRGKGRGKGTDGEVLNSSEERGLWPTGYQKLVCATMNTLFWAGKTFAPNQCVLDPTAGTAGEKKHIQDFLQERYLAMFGRVVDVLEGVEGVLGYEMMNEPHPGYIGMESLHEFNYQTDLHLGDYPSPLQSFSLGAGHTTEVPHYIRTWPFPTKISHYNKLNTQGESVWLESPPGQIRSDEKGDSIRGAGKEESKCIWARHGVWAYDKKSSRPIVLKEGYFSRRADGEKVEFYRDYYWPFVGRWMEIVGIRGMVHVEGVPNEYCPKWPQSVRADGRLVFSPHWYDLNALFSKAMGNMTVDVQGLARGMFILKALYFGDKGVIKNYSKQIGNIVDAAGKELGEVPIVIGETGVPMDLNGGEAFRTGNFKWQKRMMNAILSAIEDHMIGVNLWTYNPYNDDATGDQWNFENFSWFSESRRRKVLAARAEKNEVHVKDEEGEDLDAGGVMLDVICRPYPERIAGIPVSYSYSPSTLTFTFTFLSHPRPTDSTSGILNRRTEIYLPPLFAAAHESDTHTLEVDITDGGWKLYGNEKMGMTLWWWIYEDGEGYEHKITMRARKKGRISGERIRGGVMTVGPWHVAAVVVLFAMKKITAVGMLGLLVLMAAWDLRERRRKFPQQMSLGQ